MSIMSLFPDQIVSIHHMDSVYSSEDYGMSSYGGVGGFMAGQDSSQPSSAKTARSSFTHSILSVLGQMEIRTDTN